jgi:hypothetical protein
VEMDTLLEKTSEEYRKITNRLWILDQGCREVFANGADNC